MFDGIGGEGGRGTTLYINGNKDRKKRVEEWDKGNEKPHGKPWG